ncbi:DoxX family protein [Terrihabitans sp. B22-R8]|uniref:DoxX family protein n=1 Tax=Terrihabitans sp. B22-R8 TaxID=3425128 RepID=UPI00403CCAB8
MPGLNWPLILRWLFAAFFVFGGFGNIFASGAILADYARWGYPGWFHYVTGLLELSVAGLVIVWPRNVYGPILGGLVMLAAAGTVILHGEYSHAIAPLIVFGFCLLVSWLTARPRAGARA